MPVASRFRVSLRNDDQMPYSWGNCPFTTWADVGLARLVRLDDVDHGRIGGDGHEPRKPHATNARVMTTNMTTMATSTAVFFCWRNGLKPTARSVVELSSRKWTLHSSLSSSAVRSGI